MGTEYRAPAGGNETAPIEPTAKATSQSQLSIRWIGTDGSHRLSLLDVPELVIGRDESCDVVLPGAGTSRRHCSIRRAERGHGFVVRDLGSRNGVSLDGKPVVGDTVLADQAILRVGDWIGIVVAGDATVDDVLGSGLWGSQALRLALGQVRAAAQGGLRILLLGETGTGKELAARAVRVWARRTGDVVAVNCAALPENLIESELFGHHAGAFTGARSRLGHVQESSGGVLFLDEIGELPYPVQAKLLRVLQESEVTPVGSSRPVPVDLCVVAATHRNLHELERAEKFRTDLLMRLQGVSIRLPPLRQRRGDIWPLFERFVRQALQRRMPEVSAGFVEALHAHAWPGNVRELKQVAERLAVLDGGAPRWDSGFLPFPARPSDPGERSEGASPGQLIPVGPKYSRKNPPSKEQIETALAAAGGALMPAARLLNLAPNTFRRILEDKGMK